MIKLGDRVALKIQPDITMTVIEIKDEICRCSYFITDEVIHKLRYFPTEELFKV
jgi:hypothetical protein